MTATTARRFPLWDAARGVGFIFAAYVGAYNITHDVQPHQWFFPFGCVAVGFAATALEGIYDNAMPGGFFGPRDMQNATCMALAIGLPIVALIFGAAHGAAGWWLSGLAILAINSTVYFGFRQRGLAVLIVALCLLGVALY